MAVVLEWIETGQVFPLPLGRPVVIGRRRKGEIVLGDSHVSRRHCEAHWDGCRVWVRDLNSTNGTYLNARRRHGGVPVSGPEGVLLRLGDVLHLGDVRLRLGTPSRAEAGWLAWQGGLVVSMARQVDESGDYRDLPVLADALDEAGCTDPDLLDHLREPGPHVRGCWVVDLVLGKGYARTEQEWVICTGPGEYLICWVGVAAERKE
jgi:predicted component of type VI protein secretion system